MEELKKLRQSLELLNDDAREAKSREIEEKSEELQRFRNATARDLGRERDKVARGILKAIQDGIDSYAKANSFTLIFDSRSLLSAVPALDVSDGVLKLLNSQPAAKPQP
jgi:Skp family chaperone for outer membrane proteins